MLGRPLHIIADKKIEQAVAVIIEPESGGAEPEAFPQPAGVGHIHKRSLAGIVEEPVLPHAGDQDVGKSVIVIIANGDAHSVHFHVQPDAGSDVGKCTVPVVAVEPQRGAPLLVAGPIHPIDQKDVLPAVAVIVEKGAAGTQCLRKELAAKCAAVVLELNAGTGSYINKAEAGRSRRCRAENPQPGQLRDRGQACHAPQKRSAIHGTFTSPARMAYTTSSAVL